MQQAQHIEHTEDLHDCTTVAFDQVHENYKCMQKNVSAPTLSIHGVEEEGVTGMKGAAEETEEDTRTAKLSQNHFFTTD
jgi:hypothetical protein